MPLEQYLDYPLIAEGKTKKIFEIPGTPDVVVYSKNDITAGDGKRHEQMPDKGVLSTETAVNCFGYLQHQGIQTHFLERVDDQAFRAKRTLMISTELVARRIALPSGSYLQRHPETAPNTIFDPPKIEFFDKHRHQVGRKVYDDPLMIRDFVSARDLLFDAHKPLKKGLFKQVPMEAPLLAMRETALLVEKTGHVFEELERAWQKLGGTLVDMKIECGYDLEGNLIVADIIDNDSWRLLVGGRLVDKQNFRDGLPVDAVKPDYEWVAAASGKFLI